MANIHAHIIGFSLSMYLSIYEQALVSLKLKITVDAGVGRTFAVIIEGG